MSPYIAASLTSIKEARALEWNPLTYVGSANLSQVSFLGYAVSAGSNINHHLKLSTPLLANGTYVYSIASDNISMRVDALSSNVHSFSESAPRAPLYFTNLPSRVNFELYQPDTGLNKQQSRGYLFTIGQTTDVTTISDWSIRAYQIEAVVPAQAP